MGAFFGVGSEAGGGGGAPDPVHEYMGSEVNLLSANKNQEGKGAGGSKMEDSTDAWLGAMPGLKQFGPIFQGQTNSETDGESSTESETKSEATCETETKTETSAETEVKADAESKTETESKSDAENETAAKTEADSEGKSDSEAASSSE